MENEIEAEEVVVPAATEIVPEQDPLKIELDKVQRKGKTKAEKLLYTKNRIDQQLKELGIEEEEADDDDDKTVTVGMLKKIQAQSSTKSALELADGIPNEVERELTKNYLENRITPSGNAQEDFETAQILVNAKKNTQIIEEVLRKPQSRTQSSGNGAPAKVADPVEELTTEEMLYTKAPWNMSKAQIIAARQGGSAKFDQK